MRRLGMPYGALLGALALIGSVSAFAQEGPPPPPPPAAKAVAMPSIKGSDIHPQPAIKAIYAAYATHDVVAMGAAHGNKRLDDFILQLLSDPQFPGQINDIVVECGNSLYQSTLDRYIAGEEVATADVQKVWRNTTQPMCAVSAFYEQLFPIVRRLNQRLPASKRVRVLAADPPVQWAAVKTRDDLLRSPQDRDGSIAAVMENEVLAKHRKALMLFGTTHLYHGVMPHGLGMGAVAQYEKKYPGKTFVIADHTGFGNQTPYAPFNDVLEQRMRAWLQPSLVTTLHGTWLADALDKTESAGVLMFTKLVNGKPVTEMLSVGEGRPFDTMVDGYLYLGPRDLLTNEQPSANALLDKAFVAELRRRAALLQMPPVTDEADPDKVEAAGYKAFLDPNAP